jgi:hypothetical protein
MAISFWPLFGSARFATAQITARESHWLVYKIFWLTIDGASQVADGNQL